MTLENNEEWQKAQRGELYVAFAPELITARARAAVAIAKFNANIDESRRVCVGLWRAIVQDSRPLPPPAATQAEDDALFDDDPWVVPPIRADYGVNIKVGKNSMINWNSSFVDTCAVNIGDRVLMGPNCSFYSGGHVIDPALRNGYMGPEFGKPITISDDCWLGGNVTVLPGVTIGKGCTIGAGSVVTKDIPPFHVAAGNPAKVLRKIETAMDPEQPTDQVPASEEGKDGPEVLMAEQANQ